MSYHSTAVYPSLRAKTVLISGGAQGIGAATVKLFAWQGTRVLFLDILDEAAKETIDDIASSSKDVEAARGFPIITPVYYHCDLVNLPELQTTVNHILQLHGPIHVLINNAAITAADKARLNTDQVTPEAWDLNVNGTLRHVFFLTQAVLPGMKVAGSGSIVNLGSISWRISAKGMPVYGACKAAIMGLTHMQSKEFGTANIRINSVMPGAIATERQRREVLTPEYRAEVMANQALQRDLEPEEVAKVVVFLGSDEASGVTGSSYVVDGGWCSDP